MKTSMKGVIVLAVLVGLVGGVYGLKQFIHKSPPTNKESRSQVRAKGNPSAPYRIVEFIDFECPACAAGAKYLKDVMEKNKSLIYLEMKYYPLERIHRHAFLSAMYAECALRQGKFWAFYDQLIDQQPKWRQLGDATPAFVSMARKVGLDLQRLDACLQDPSTREAVEKTRAEGRRRQVRSTPTYFVNGQMVVGLRNLKGILEKEGSRTK